MQIIADYLKTTIDSLRDNNPAFLPTENFCVRKTTSVFINNTYWIYADLIPWDNKYWPNTYDTSIHAFSSPDCRDWTYHGEVVRHREESTWDYGGVATPGAIFLNGKVYIFYSGREKTNGKGWRQIGVAIADNPAGPFQKNLGPIIPATNQDSHLDDPIPIISENGKNIDLYYRQADRHLPSPNYSIRLISSSDSGHTWSEPITVLSADNKTLRACETLDAIRINGKTILTTFDHFIGDGLKTAFHSSSDGKSFSSEATCYLEDILPKEWIRPSCAFNIMFISDNTGNPHHIGITRETDDKRHYNMAIHQI